MPPRRIRIGPTKRKTGENPWEGRGRERREAREGKEEKEEKTSDNSRVFVVFEDYVVSQRQYWCVPVEQEQS